MAKEDSLLNPRPDPPTIAYALSTTFFNPYSLPVAAFAAGARATWTINQSSNHFDFTCRPRPVASSSLLLRRDNAPVPFALIQMAELCSVYRSPSLAMTSCVITVLGTTHSTASVAFEQVSPGLIAVTLSLSFT